MTDFQRAGGYSGLAAALTYVFGMALLFALLLPAGYDPEAPDVAFAVNNLGLMTVWNVVIYPVNALVLVVLTLALGDRLKSATPVLARLAVVQGLIWSALIFAAGMAMIVGMRSAAAVFDADPVAAARIFEVSHLIENGIGGGVELAGGVWVIYVAVASLRGQTLPRLLALFGAAIGLAGIATLIPAAAPIGGAIFGLGFILWFAWAGIVLLKG